jgi:hypothetical protein
MIPGAIICAFSPHRRLMSQILRTFAATTPWLPAILLPALAGCASTPEPEAFSGGVLVLAENAADGTSSEDIAREVSEAGSDFVLLAARRDSAWFEDVAAGSGLVMSGPSIEQGLGFAYLAGAEPLGDTTIAIPVGSDGAVVLHDALYELGDGVFLDFIAFRADDAPDPHALIQSFLAYMATDVMTNAPLVLGIHAQDDRLADSLAVLLRPSFQPPAACDDGGDAPSGVSGLRLFIGTPVQIRCEEIVRPPGVSRGLLAKLLLLR